LGRVAGARWAIEECFQTAKNETGLDHYQVRQYEAWRLIQDSVIDLVRPILSWNNQPSIKIAE
jgi:hypothetical protein